MRAADVDAQSVLSSPPSLGRSFPQFARAIRRGTRAAAGPWLAHGIFYSRWRGLAQMRKSGDRHAEHYVRGSWPSSLHCWRRPRAERAGALPVARREDRAAGRCPDRPPTSWRGWSPTSSARNGASRSSSRTWPGAAMNIGSEYVAHADARRLHAAALPAVTAVDPAIALSRPQIRPDEIRADRAAGQDSQRARGAAGFPGQHRSRS